jgi:hypothetical protein
MRDILSAWLDVQTVPHIRDEFHIFIAVYFYIRVSFQILYPSIHIIELLRRSQDQDQA